MERALTGRPVVGIFVGGRGTRMGGRAKGLLLRPDGVTLVAHLLALAEAVGATPVLVGSHAAYGHLGVRSLPDAESGRGPLSGLSALLDFAGDSPAIALACDMPYVTESFLMALLTAHPEAPALAPKPDLWEPLAARYDGRIVLPVVRDRMQQRLYSLQGLLAAVHAVRFEHPDERLATRDWDTEQDQAADMGRHS